MQKHGRRLLPIIQTGAWQTYPMRTWAVGNYGVVNLECKKQVLLWACPTPTKSNCWCRLRTAGGVPTPHGFAVKSQRFFSVSAAYLYRALLLQCCICFIFKPQHCSLGVTVYLYWIFHINEISIVLDVQKKKRNNIKIIIPNSIIFYVESKQIINWN